MIKQIAFLAGYTQKEATTFSNEVPALEGASTTVAPEGQEPEPNNMPTSFPEEKPASTKALSTPSEVAGNLSKGYS